MLLNDVVVATDQVNTLERDLRSVLIQLQNTIQSKTAVPTNQVLTHDEIKNKKYIGITVYCIGMSSERVWIK